MSRDGNDKKVGDSCILYHIQNAQIVMHIVWFISISQLLPLCK